MSTALELKPKRVVFPIAGKDGVGKTTVMATLAEWYESTAYTADLFDMDPDNKAEGCFKALFAKAHKLPARRAGHTTSCWESRWSPAPT